MRRSDDVDIYIGWGNAQYGGMGMGIWERGSLCLLLLDLFDRFPFSLPFF